MVDYLFKALPELKLFVEPEDINIDAPHWDNEKRLGTTDITIPSRYSGIMHVEYTIDD
jgi:hypothetical protein